MEEANLSDLVRFANHGDSVAWEALVNHFANLVWSVARGHSLNEDDAADVSQTTWMRLAEHLHRVKDPDRLGAWLATTARRESLRMLKHRQRHVRIESCVDIPGDAEDPIVRGILQLERDEELWRAFDSLSGPCKALLRMLLADPPPSYAEVSSAFDMPIGSIGPTRARCLERLRREVELRQGCPGAATASPATASPATASPATASPATASPATASAATASPGMAQPAAVPFRRRVS